MEVFCNQCRRVVGNIPDDRIPHKGGKVTCPRCREPIMVKKGERNIQIAQGRDPLPRRNPSNDDTLRKSGRQSTGHDSRLEVTWRRTFLVWWSYAWRCFVFSVLAGVVFGGIGGLVFGFMGRSDLASLVGTIMGYWASIAVSIIVLKSILQKRFGEFSIRLMENL